MFEDKKKITVGEGVTWGGAALACLMASNWWAIPAAAFFLACTWALRRNDELDEWAHDAADGLRANGHDILASVVGALPAPDREPPQRIPARRQLQAPPQQRRDTRQLQRTRQLERPQASRMPNGKPTPESWLQGYTQVVKPDWTMRQLIEYVNGEETWEDCPHLFIAAPSRTGKTLLAQFIAATRAGHKLVIIDRKRPKGYDESGPKWAGLPYVTLDADGSYTSIKKALEAVCREVEKRYKEQETARKAPPWLTVIIDELKESYRECPDLARFYRYIISIGAEARVRLILISTSDRARINGFEGEADSMESLAWIRLGKFALSVNPEAEDLGDKRFAWAVIQDGSEWRTFDNTRTVEYLRKVPLRRSAAWQGVTYNCQLRSDDDEPWEAEAEALPRHRRPPTPPPAPSFEPDLRPAPQVESLPVVAAGGMAKAANVALRVPQPKALPIPEDDEFLTQLLTLAPVNGGCERKSERPGERQVNEDVNGPVNGLGNDVHTPKDRLLSAKLVLSEASVNERERLGEVLKLLTTGMAPSEAIRKAFSTRYYARGRALYDAYSLLQRAGLIRHTP